VIDSGLGGLAGGRLDDGLRQPMVLSIGLKGIRSADADKVELLIADTIGGLADRGIDPLTVEAALIRSSLRCARTNTGSFPARIVFMWALRMAARSRSTDAASPSRRRCPPSRAALRAASATSRILLRRISSTIPTYRRGAQAGPGTGRTRGARGAGAPGARARRHDGCRHRRVWSEDAHASRRSGAPDPPEALATIPTLKLSTCRAITRPFPIEATSLRDTRVLYHDLLTNGVVYLDLGFDLHTLPAELLPYVTVVQRA